MRAIGAVNLLIAGFNARSAIVAFSDGKTALGLVLLATVAGCGLLGALYTWRAK